MIEIGPNLKDALAAVAFCVMMAIMFWAILR